VEDDELSRSLMKMKLKRRGVNVYTASNGQEAVQFLKNNPEAGLIFMDLKMPVMDGYEATRKIREINPDIAIVALSAYVMKFDREKAIESGCNDFMPKPVHNKQLDLVLEKYM
jgi:CheY-like chemotaxis protein